MLEEESELKSGDIIKVISGEFKGKKAEVIAIYNNSISVEFDIKLEDETKLRTVLNHAEYELDVK